MHQLALFLLQDPRPEQILPVIGAFILIYLVIAVVALALIIFPLWKICEKAGLSPWLSLLVLVPFGFLILLYVLAFADWKVVPAPTQQAWMPPSQYPPQYPAQAPPQDSSQQFPPQR